MRASGAALRGDGITTLEDLVALPTIRLARYPYAGASRAAQLHAHAQALLGAAPYRKAAPPPALPVPALFFDIESRPDTQEPWAFGWLDAAGVPGIAIVSPRHVTAKRTQARIADIPVVFVRDMAAGWGHIAAQVARTPLGMVPDAAHDAVLTPALTYLRADLEALRHVWLWLRARGGGDAR
ncbi:hypothetical protein K2Z83_12880 [Oscillochloris sp. ZM17-4]|uniref:hypothetical protein n=1 Tax=Oscillochloris sp. ZM17-4 TaxID=2866714 RepID=UPI001C7331CF|nr:hypothetical protein [Oscillochloris sp. ZM17-4]MBX0328572.1 hypothetical protein [Oscillochloris sp. ZM17-4]